ncbi:hypothetical protein T265_07667 [Opisthorchis viverrini]|uniref:Mitochondrial outer membrane transport complex Sam37/metaxin N-terminal domain-containing protein n=1 Tax=Opisthorchis viverrini TaxID=6198 RepID=A0A074ZGK1_OPIVI|nr:hypothetical protein T265_07667 [Opisthorchis viverrini]KER24782.1 hypothetical protein T265_07667 [Opisthorchis viverrini]
MVPLVLLSKDIEHILPADEAATRAGVCFLSKIGNKFTLERTTNADSCSPDRLLPLVCFKGHLLSGYDALCNALEATRPVKGSVVQIGDSQTDDSLILKSMRRVCLVWLSDVLRNIMLYFTWIHEPTFRSFTVPRTSPNVPWPLSHLVLGNQRKRYKTYMSSIGWADKTLPDVLAEMEGVCFGVTQLLDPGPYCFGRPEPGRLDALIYGYWSVFLEFNDIFSPLNQVVASCRPAMELLEKLTPSDGRI